MGTRSSLNYVNLEKLNTRKFLLMSRGFAGAGLSQKMSVIQDITNFFQVVAGDGNAAVDPRA